MSAHSNARPLAFAELDTGCFVCVSHKTNPDGYFRKLWGDSRGGGIHEMFHRFIYRAHHGLEHLPEGYEVDHVCRNRACCNPHHLRLLEGSAHAVKSNQERYAARHEAARKHWLDAGGTGTALAAKFGVSFSIGCRWVRQWNQAA